MKKTFLLPMCLLGMVLMANSQNKKEMPPPPPPPPKIEQAPPPPPPPPPPIIEAASEEMEAFYKRNPTIARPGWKDGQKIIVTLKDSTKEKYDLTNEADQKAFKNKYGEIPDGPPPPPPPPPPTPVKKKLVI